jgi:hypothetical protein
MEQYKQGEESAMYEIDYTTKSALLDVCSVKQPFVFASPITPVVTFLDEFQQTNDRIRIVSPEGRSFYQTTKEASQTISLSQPPVISEGNQYWIQHNIPLMYDMRQLENLWRPSWNIQTTYDVCFGSSLASTRFRWHCHSLRFLYVPHGTIRLKMTPFFNTTFFNTQYEIFDFWSDINVWDDENKLTKRISFLDFEVHAGHVLYIPPYFWYSVQFVEPNTFFYSFTYSTFVNIVAHAHHWIASSTTTSTPTLIPPRMDDFLPPQEAKEEAVAEEPVPDE